MKYTMRPSTFYNVPCAFAVVTEFVILFCRPGTAHILDSAPVASSSGVRTFSTTTSVSSHVSPTAATDSLATKPMTLSASRPVAAAAESRFSSLFSFSSPLSLFPPNAIITLTDDNGTSFPARPAAFGPPFPDQGLSGQLWVGGGFAEESFEDNEDDWELGCSDLHGWDNHHQNLKHIAATKAKNRDRKVFATPRQKWGYRRPEGRNPGDPNVLEVRKAPSLKSSLTYKKKSKSFNDGTDNYLVAGLGSDVDVEDGTSGQARLAPADIQLLQEAAEVQGKVVLLSRGGCGFADKVMWAQRRGAVAVIVGDNQRGGPLIQMYARGDTSNITIPSIFTSRTTAHILSTLMHPTSFVRSHVTDKSRTSMGYPRDARAPALSKRCRVGPQNGGGCQPSALSEVGLENNSRQHSASGTVASTSWIRALLTWPGMGKPQHTSQFRAPQSGRLDWDHADASVVAENSRSSGDEDDSAGRDQTDVNDQFQIGIEDWRDPDIVSSLVVAPALLAATEEKSKRHYNLDSFNTPSSGQYDRGSSKPPSEGFISRLFHAEEDHGPQSKAPNASNSPSNPVNDVDGREGLWVTITPSSSASPFLDTLLVLVVSPLVTLTIVYALLILRTRIRRRRWRAPKSVVDRLPVRTFYTVAPSPAGSPPGVRPTDPSSPAPLLHGQAAPRSSSSVRQLSQAEDLGRHTNEEESCPDPTSEAPTRAKLRPSSSGSTTRTRSPHEQSEWKKNMGRQVECAVCLEEYVDGVSRVMSLPCGHEFHVECITPWLTTKRRTCPICKGDVVKSLARGTGSGPRYEPYRDDSDSDDDDEPVDHDTPFARSNTADENHDIESQDNTEVRNRPALFITWVGSIFRPVFRRPRLDYSASSDDGGAR